jgi:hypothetical protein
MLSNANIDVVNDEINQNSVKELQGKLLIKFVTKFFSFIISIAKV